MRISVKSAILETGSTNFRASVIPSPNLRLKNELWLLKAALYGAFKANTKCEIYSYTSFNLLGLHPSVDIPQLCTKTISEVTFVLIAIKIVDVILMKGAHEKLECFRNIFDDIYVPRSICYGPEHLEYDGLSIIQHVYMYCGMNGGKKMKLLAPYPVSPVRRRQPLMKMNNVERSAFISFNSSLVCSVFLALPFVHFMQAFCKKSLKT